MSVISPTTTPLIQPVANWVDEGKDISVFQENEQLKYSIIQGSETEIGTISLKLYDTPEHKRLALNLIIMFKRVLLGNSKLEHRFLPIFCTACDKPTLGTKVIIALFARVRATETGGKEVVEAQWGVYDAGAVSWLGANRGDTNAFLVGAPLYRNKMNIYCQHFKEDVTFSQDEKVQSIALRFVSGLDRTLFLDEDTCAITLVSAQKNDAYGRFFKLGHALVAWEGIENGSYFLKSTEITTNYPDRQSGQARIRIVTREIPSDYWFVGPTCFRTKEATKKMEEYIFQNLTFIQDETWSSFVKFNFFAPLKNLFKSTYELERERRTFKSVEHCLSFAVSVLQRADIFLPEPGRAIPYIEPNLYVMNLNENYAPEIRNSQIVYRHKTAPREDDQTNVRIIVHLLENFMDAVNSLEPSQLSSSPS